MTIQEFIAKAIEGGWQPWERDPNTFRVGSVTDTDALFYENNTNSPVHELLLTAIFIDPHAWEAVGKIEAKSGRGFNLDAMAHGAVPTTQEYDWQWKEKMRGMVDALISGQTLEQFISTL